MSLKEWERDTWCAATDRKLQSIYNQLSNFDILMCEEQKVIQLFDLLETIDVIQEQHLFVVPTIASSNDCLNKKRERLNIQKEILKKSIDLLLETVEK